MPFGVVDVLMVPRADESTPPQYRINEVQHNAVGQKLLWPSLKHMADVVIEALPSLLEATPEAIERHRKAIEKVVTVATGGKTSFSNFNEFFQKYTVKFPVGEFLFAQTAFGNEDLGPERFLVEGYLSQVGSFSWVGLLQPCHCVSKFPIVLTPNEDGSWVFLFSYCPNEDGSWAGCGRSPPGAQPHASKGAVQRS